ncbi:MAG: lipid II:glycine glycyltransferase FemX [Polyangiaceae bacterium]
MELLPVLAARLSAEDGAIYDAFVERAGGAHYTQTRAWRSIASAGKHVHSTYFLAMDGGKAVGAAHVLRPALGLVAGPVAFVERGPVCECPADLARVLPLLAKALRRRGVLRLHVMPYLSGEEKSAAEHVLRENRFRDVQANGGAHARTLRLDLRGDPFAGGERESLRRKLKQAEKAGVRAMRGKSSDVVALALLYRQMMRQQSRPSKSRAYFDAVARFVDKGRGALFLSEQNGEAIAAAFVVHHAEIATFVLGASTIAQKPFSKMAPAMAEAVRWAKAEGCTAFDLGGLPRAGDRDPKRAQIAQFKLDFSKSPVDLVGEHARWF